MGRRRMLATVVAAGGLLVAGAAGFAGFAYAETGDTAITKVSVNGGKNVAVGTTYVKSFTVAVTATDDSGIKDADFYLHGPASAFAGPAGAVTCAASSATQSTCKATFKVDPRVDLWDNSQAGTWYVAAQVEANDGAFLTAEKAGTFTLQRYAKLSRNAYPEPVSKGGTITVTGTLSRANWETRSYTGYTSQSVRLQYRAMSGGAYSDLKTMTSGSGGALKTTTTATVDRCWRWQFAGTSTTMPVTASGDCVDVR